MGSTRTGNFPIGFRRMGCQWQQDLNAVIEWAKANSLEVIDLGRDADQIATQVVDAGLRVGSVDLAEWQGMISADKGKREEAVARNSEYIAACAAAGAMNHFIVMLPENKDLPPEENFGYMVESFNALAPTFEANSAHLVIEAWPGPGALVCTPEAHRAFFRECPSPAMGVNYDPSHLIRMGICPLRFLSEFAERVFHIHGKDTELMGEGLYEYGNTLPRIFGSNPGFGSTYWRYTIPGHGQMRWTQGFRMLEAAGYKGCISVELEDANFNGAEDTEKQGLVFGGRFLESC